MSVDFQVAAWLTAAPNGFYIAWPPGMPQS
jgi:hypothetical protein